MPEVTQISLDFSFHGESYLFGLGAARTPPPPAPGGPCALLGQALQAMLLWLPLLLRGRKGDCLFFHCLSLRLLGTREGQGQGQGQCGS